MPARTPSEVIDALHELGQKIARRAPEIEERGMIPPDLYDEIVATGVFRSLLPARLGGLGATLYDVNEMIIAAARADGSVGWVVMIGTGLSLAFPLLPDATVAELFANGPDVRIRGAIAPKGVATPVEGGYRISGQWPFVSGGPGTQFVGGSCLVVEDGNLRMSPLGLPDMLLTLMRAEDLEFLDTWHVVGMRGTNSCDVAARDVFVPVEHTLSFFAAHPPSDSPTRTLALRVALSPGHGAIAVGIAQGALDDIAALAATKRAAMNPLARLAEDQVFQHRLGEQQLRLAAARALLDAETAKLCHAAADGRELSPQENLQARSMASFVTSLCIEVVDAAYTMAGSVSLYDSSSLQRRLRDIHVASQHVAVSGETYRPLGAVLAGEEVPPVALF